MKNYNLSDLNDKVVVIVGGFGLIGKELCQGFCQHNVKLVVVDIGEKKKFIDGLNKINKNTIFHYQIDINNEKAVKQLFNSIIIRFKAIDVFVNCSFPKTPDWSLNVEKVKYGSIKSNLINHLGSYYNLTQQVTLIMKKQKKGSIINFSSIYGLVRPNFQIYEWTKMTSPSAYALIKGGINTMTRYFASYYGKYNVRVNCISPGGVFDNQNKKFVKAYEDFVPLKRMAKPEDLVLPTLFLASDGSSYITGHNLLVDGGWTII